MTDCNLIDKLRRFKIFEMAIFDWVITFIGIYLIKWWFPDYGFIQLSIGIIMLGIVVHYVLNVPTMLGYYLGLNQPPIRKTC